MNTATDTRDDETQYAEMDAFSDELRAQLTTHRAGVIAHAVDDVSDLIADLLAVLYDDDQSPRVTADLVEFVDEAFAILHKIRTQAITENRRRLDAAMERSAKLLGIDHEGGDAR